MRTRDPLGQHIPTMTAVFEGGLFFMAVVLGLVLGLPTTTLVRFTWQGVVLGVVTALPIIAGFFLLQIAPVRSIQMLNFHVRRLVVPLLRSSTLAQVAAISLFAGLGEEMLFRAIIQQGLQQWIGWSFSPELGLVAALMITAVLFGVVHAMTPLYALVAAALGLYFGLIWLWTDNLLVPILAHAVYDFVAILWYLHGPKRLVRRRDKRSGDH